MPIVGDRRPVAAVPSDDASSVPSRQCGRCRAVFPGDPTIQLGTIPDWWLCPPCHSALLGPGRHQRAADADQGADGTRRGR